MEGDEGDEVEHSGWGNWPVVYAPLSKNNVFKAEREESFKKERIVNCAKELLKIRLEYISVY